MIQTVSTGQGQGLSTISSEQTVINSDYEFAARSNPESYPMVEIDFNQQQKLMQQQQQQQPPQQQQQATVGFEFSEGTNTTSAPTTTTATTTTNSGTAKFEVDFNQQEEERTPADDDDDDEGTTREGHETEFETPGTEQTVSTSEKESDGLLVEFEEESHAIQRILALPMKVKKPQQSLVLGKLSIMATAVSEETLVLPLSSPALRDILEHRQTYRAIAIRCSCEIVFTRRVVVKKVIKWTRFSVLLLRGPSDVALKRLRKQLEAAHSDFLQAMVYDPDKPRPRLLTSEHLPDNLEIVTSTERTGKAVSRWERLPLEMPQNKQGPPLIGKPKSLILPNNVPIGSVLSHVHPNWGFQGTQPVPQTLLFQSAVEMAETMEKQQKSSTTSGALANPQTHQ